MPYQQMHFRAETLVSAFPIGYRLDSSLFHLRRESRTINNRPVATVNEQKLNLVMNSSIEEARYHCSDLLKLEKHLAFFNI